MSETKSTQILTGTPLTDAILATVQGGKTIDGADSVTPEEDYIDKLNSLCRQLEKQLADSEYMGNLLAIIHCDGGHYRAEHGNKKATDDAIEIFRKIKRENQRLRKRERE